MLIKRDCAVFIKPIIPEDEISPSKKATPNGAALKKRLRESYLTIFFNSTSNTKVPAGAPGGGFLP